MDSDYLKDVFGTVEANSYEKHCLWLSHAKDAEKYGPTDRIRYEWKETGHGYMAHVGDFGERPVWISLLTATVDGKHLLFWHVTSPVADYDLVEKWLIENMPNAVRSDGYLNRTDPMNFSNILR